MGGFGFVQQEARSWEEVMQREMIFVSVPDTERHERILLSFIL